MASSPDHDMLMKLVIIGDSGVGKTNLMTQYCTNSYKDNYTATIGVDFTVKSIELDSKRVKLQIWDTAGQERFRNITATYYKGASGIVLTYSINDEKSFRNVSNWMKQVENTVGDEVTKILIGTKADLEAERKVSKEAAASYARLHGMEWSEVSSKSGKGVNELFLTIAQEIKDRKIDQRKWEEKGLNIASFTRKSFNGMCGC